MLRHKEAARIYTAVAARAVAAVYPGEPQRNRFRARRLTMALASMNGAPHSWQVPGCVTLERFGAMVALCEAAFDEARRRCVTLMELARVSSFDEVADYAMDEDSGLTCGESARLLSMWQQHCINPTGRDLATLHQWAQARMIEALYDFAVAYACGGMLELRDEVMNVLRDVCAFTLSASVLFLLMLERYSQPVAWPCLRGRPGASIPDISPTVILLIVSRILSPRAPQFYPACGVNQIEVAAVRVTYCR